MTVSRPMSNRLGIHAPKIEVIREERGLTPAGFRQDSTDAAGADKEAALAELYRRADAHLPAGIGGPVPAPGAENESDSDAAASETAGDQEDDG